MKKGSECMNKYQREKKKRRKQLAALGITYYGQKKVFKLCKNDLAQVDQAIEGLKLYKQLEPTLKKIITQAWEGVKQWAKNIANIYKAQ